MLKLSTKLKPRNLGRTRAWRVKSPSWEIPALEEGQRRRLRVSLWASPSRLRLPGVWHQTPAAEPTLQDQQSLRRAGWASLEAASALALAGESAPAFQSCFPDGRSVGLVRWAPLVFKARGFGGSCQMWVMKVGGASCRVQSLHSSGRSWRCEFPPDCGLPLGGWGLWGSVCTLSCPLLLSSLSPPPET